MPHAHCGNWWGGGGGIYLHNARLGMLNSRSHSCIRTRPQAQLLVRPVNCKNVCPKWCAGEGLVFQCESMWGAGSGMLDVCIQTPADGSGHLLNFTSQVSQAQGGGPTENALPCVRNLQHFQSDVNLSRLIAEVSMVHAEGMLHALSAMRVQLWPSQDYQDVCSPAKRPVLLNEKVHQASLGHC